MANISPNNNINQLSTHQIFVTNFHYIVRHKESLKEALIYQVISVYAHSNRIKRNTNLSSANIWRLTLLVIKILINFFAQPPSPAKVSNTPVSPRLSTNLSSTIRGELSRVPQRRRCTLMLEHYNIHDKATKPLDFNCLMSFSC